jgi:hypothetical protein
VAALEDRDDVTGALADEAPLVVLAIVGVGSLVALVVAECDVAGGALAVTAAVLDVVETPAPPGEQALSTATTAQRAICRRPSRRIFAVPWTRPTVVTSPQA